MVAEVDSGTTPPAGRVGRPPLRLGVLQFFSWPNRNVPLETMYARALDRVDRMESSGAFDAVWLAEHHFNTYSICPSVHMMGLQVANRTKRLRIGMAVSVASMYHPLRLAEEVAMLDVFSGGRVNWGAGRGNDATEFEVFGLNRDTSYAKFRENVKIVLKAWSDERVSYDGEFIKLRNVEVMPKPLQKPYPPTWVAASSPDAIAWAAEEGFDILMDPHASHVDIGNKRAAYQKGLEQNGASITGRIIPMARLIAVGATDDAARETARRGAQWTVSAYVNPGRRKAMEALGGTPAPPQPEVADPVARYVNDVVLWGSPKRMVDEIQRLREEIHLDYLMCAPLSFESFQMFVDEVIPALARVEPLAVAGVPY